MTTRRGALLRHLTWLITTFILTTLALGGSAQATVRSSDPSASRVSAAIPTAPSEVTAALDDTKDAVVVTWSGADGGGSSITKYVVNAHSPMGGPQVEVGPTESSALLKGMLRYKDYYYQVTVWNAEGNYAMSKMAGPIATTAPLPTAPANVTAVAGVESAVVNWTAANGNGTPIEGYTITASPSGDSRSTLGDVTSVAFDGLEGDVTVAFTVTAWTNRGISEPSAPSASVTPTEAPESSNSPWDGEKSESGKPELPRVPRTSVHGSRVVLKWATPDSTIVISSYRVTLKKKGFNKIGMRLPGTASRAVFKGIRPGAYATTLTARNRYGWSEVRRGPRVVVR